LNNRNSLKDFLNDLDKNNIIYLSWKNNHELNSSLCGEKDVDIFVPNSLKEQFIDLSKKHLWIEVENSVAKYDHVHHFYKVINSKTSFHLHVYFQIVTGESWIKEFNLPIESFMVEEKIRDSVHNIWVLNKKAQAYIFIIRHFLKTGSIFSRILYLKEKKSYEREWKSCSTNLEEIYSYGPLDINTFIENSGLSKKFSIPSYLTSLSFRLKFFKYLRFNRYFLWVYRSISFLKRLLNKLIFNRKKIICNKGLLVSISGADGAGKSSMIKQLNHEFSSFLSCKKYTLGKPQGLLTEKIRLFFERKPSKIIANQNLESKKETTLIKAVLAIYLAMLRFNMAKKALKKSKNGNLVLVDRWPTMSIGKMDSAKIKVSEKSKNITRFLSVLEQKIYNKMPSADICIYLNVSLNTAIMRNESREKIGKETKEEITIRHKENDNILPKANKIIQFNNDGNFIEKLSEIRNLIVSEIILIQRQ
jgi:thymidylate kinase